MNNFEVPIEESLGIDVCFQPPDGEADFKYSTWATSTGPSQGNTIFGFGDNQLWHLHCEPPLMTDCDSMILRV